MNLKTTFYTIMDGQVEHTILTLEDMVWTCVTNFKGSWVDHFSLIEFLTIIVIIQAIRWLFFRLFMVGGIGLLLDCLSW
ncbi:hypothetical protein QP65_00165 [Staphylococcus aureus]|nr:hypothetical protein QP65_00165 [Staphylococcus aureus]